MDPVITPLLQLALIVILGNTLGWMTFPLVGKRVGWFWFSNWLFKKLRRLIGSVFISVGREISGHK